MDKNLEFFKGETGVMCIRPGVDMVRDLGPATLDYFGASPSGGFPDRSGGNSKNC